MRLTIFILILFLSLVIVDAIFTEKKINRQSKEIKILNARVDSLRFSIYLDSINKVVERRINKLLGNN